MLAAIENKLEELFETIESLPSEKVEAAEKVSQHLPLLDEGTIATMQTHCRVWQLYLT